MHPNIHSLCAQHALMSCSTPPLILNPWLSSPRYGTHCNSLLGTLTGMRLNQLLTRCGPALKECRRILRPSSGWKSCCCCRCREMA